MKDLTAGDKPEQQAEHDLIARFRSGDSRAFDRIVEIHVDRVFALAVELLGSRQDAEDVTQEVLIKLWRHLPRLRTAATLRPWLYRVCVNQCNDWRRWRRRRAATSQALDSSNPQAATDPTAPMAAANLRRKVRAALAGLPHQQRMAFTLRHFADLSVAQIAETLRCAPATVRVHLSRATSRLRDALSEEVNNHESLSRHC